VLQELTQTFSPSKQALCSIARPVFSTSSSPKINTNLKHTSYSRPIIEDLIDLGTGIKKKYNTQKIKRDEIERSRDTDIRIRKQKCVLGKRKMYCKVRRSSILEQILNHIRSSIMGWKELSNIKILIFRIPNKYN
jgi:hypothetical protein